MPAGNPAGYSKFECSDVHPVESCAACEGLCCICSLQIACNLHAYKVEESLPDVGISLQRLSGVVWITWFAVHAVAMEEADCWHTLVMTSAAGMAGIVLAKLGCFTTERLQLLFDPRQPFRPYCLHKAPPQCLLQQHENCLTALPCLLQDAGRDAHEAERAVPGRGGH